MNSKMLFIYMITSSFSIGSPRDPIEVLTNISVEVVKPIEIISKTNIYHSIFKGVSKGINGSFNLEVKASSGHSLRVGYEREVKLINEKGGQSIKMNVDYIIGSVFATNGIGASGGLENRVEVRAPAYGYRKIYEIPYKIDLTGAEDEGNYRGIINIQIDYM